MEVYFDPDKTMPFTLEVGYFDTIKDIKEKVSKYQGIPVHEQTLVFEGKTLSDDLIMLTSDIFDGSHLQLITTSYQQQTEETPSDSSSAQKIKILLKNSGETIEIDLNDPVLKMKEKIKEREGTPLSRIGIYANGIELHGNKTLHECQLVDGSEVEITVKPPMPPPTHITTPTMTFNPNAAANMSLTGNYPKKLKVNVLSGKGENIMLEVNRVTQVSELRNELQKARNQGVEFSLPEGGYFFIHKQDVMDEDQSFRWHGVEQGDTIEVFPGYVTDGA